MPFDYGRLRRYGSGYGQMQRKSPAANLEYYKLVSSRQVALSGRSPAVVELHFLGVGRLG